MSTRLVLCTVLAPLLATAGPATADDRDATCERLRAEGRAEALTLYAPRIQVEGARVPGVLQIQDPSAVVTEGYQVRAAITFSPVDALKGRAIERIAEAECTREQLAGELADVIAVGSGLGITEATRAELAYLEEHLADIDAIVAEVSARFAAQRATAVEVDDVRGRRSSIVVRMAELRASLATLEVVEVEPEMAASLSSLAGKYRDASIAVQERRGDLRALSPWRVEIRGGLAAADGADWFAVVELGYSFGGLFQGSANRRAAAARAKELDQDDREVGTRLQQLQTVMRRSLEALEPAQAALEDEVASLRAERDRVRTLESDSARHLLARLEIDVVVLEARRVYTAALLTARRPYAGDVK